MMPSESWPHVVYVRKAGVNLDLRMKYWCTQVCEGLWNASYVSWQLDAWKFTDAVDALQFKLTWSDHVYDAEDQ
jgi:hypothetical protein